MTALAGGAADRVALAILLPFAGFLVNGAVAFVRPQAKRLVSVVGVGSVAAAFVVGVTVFLAVLRRAPRGAVRAHPVDLDPGRRPQGGRGPPGGPALGRDAAGGDGGLRP